MTAVMFLMLFCACFIVVYPALFRWADRRLCRLQLSLHAHPGSGTEIPQQNNIIQPTRHHRHSQSDFADADACEYLASMIRSGVSSKDALMSLCETQSVSSVLSHTLRTHLSVDVPLAAALSHVQHIHSVEPSLFLDCLCSSHVDGNFFPVALEYSAQLLRDNAHAALSARAHTAHARTTSRILTGLPVVSVLAAIVVSQSMRDVVLSRGGVILLLLGLVLNIAGWWWMRALTSHIDRVAHFSEPERLTQSFCVSLMAGCSVIQACERWSDVSTTGATIASAIRTGESLSDALLHLGHAFGHDGQTLRRSVLEAHLSGVPTQEVVSRFLADCRQQSAFEREERARQLPAKLSMPVVFCVLPAFLLVVLIPVALASLRSLPLT